jgi:lipoyl synthase
VLRIRFLGRVHYRDALALQHALFRSRGHEHLLLMEHAPVYTMGASTRAEHVLVAPESLGCEVVRADRGGDVTYHGPGQLVGYPVLDVAMGHRAIPLHVASIEGMVIEALRKLGLQDVGLLPGQPGVWVQPSTARPRKICAIGVRVSRGRSMHGFALNVHPDMSMFDRIVPCGIHDLEVTSLRAEGVVSSMDEVIDAIVGSSHLLGRGAHERQDAASRQAVRASAGDGLALAERKPAWLRVKARMDAGWRDVHHTVRELGLVTVCEEAGCPNIYECWADGTATFMVNGDRCTRACGFCLVDTSRPLALDPAEPRRVAEAVRRMGLAHAVVTAVARDDLPDGGAGAIAATVEAIRAVSPSSTVEVLIPDCKGDPSSLATIFDTAPEVMNHNLETVLRLQSAVRPSASYARSLAVLARAKAVGLTTKSGLMVGLGETEEEVGGTLVDLRSVGVDIVTIGQYLRPSASHLPVARWWRPEEIESLRQLALALGFHHAEASPLTRSSHRARSAMQHALGQSLEPGNGPAPVAVSVSRSPSRSSAAQPVEVGVVSSGPVL